MNSNKIQEKTTLSKILLLPMILLFMISVLNPFVLADVFISEIMYNPNGDNADYQWIELYNNDSSSVNISTWTINGYDFDNITINAGEFAILARNLTKFEEFWGNSYNVANVTAGFSLSEITILNLTNASNSTMDYVAYNSTWNNNNDSYSIEKIVLTGVSDDSSNWQIGSLNGTPGADNDDASIENVNLGLYLDITKVKIDGAENDEDELRVGEKFTVKVYIENNANFDIEDIDLDVRIIDDDGDEIEDEDGVNLQEDSSFDLDEGDNQKDLSENDYIFTFTLPYELDDGDDFTVLVEVEGYNADNNSMRVRDVHNTTTIEIEKPKHEIMLKSLKFLDSRVSCTDNAKLSLKVMNVGRKDEEVKLEIYNTELGFWIDDEFELDKDYYDDDNEHSETYTLYMLDNIKPGSYQVNVKMTYDDGDEDITETETLTIEECKKVSQTTPTKAKEKEIDLKPLSSIADTGEIVTARQVERSSFRDTEEYWMMLIIAVIFLSGAIIFIGGLVYYSYSSGKRIKLRKKDKTDSS